MDKRDRLTKGHEKHLEEVDIFIISVVNSGLTSLRPYVKIYEIVYFKMCSLVNLNYFFTKLLKAVVKFSGRQRYGAFCGTEKGVDQSF